MFAAENEVLNPEWNILKDLFFSFFEQISLSFYGHLSLLWTPYNSPLAFERIWNPLANGGSESYVNKKKAAEEKEVKLIIAA